MLSIVYILMSISFHNLKIHGFNFCNIKLPMLKNKIILTFTTFIIRCHSSNVLIILWKTLENNQLDICNMQAITYQLTTSAVPLSFWMEKFFGLVVERRLTRWQQRMGIQFYPFAIKQLRMSSLQMCSYLIFCENVTYTPFLYSHSYIDRDANWIFVFAYGSMTIVVVVFYGFNLVQSFVLNLADMWYLY